MAKYINGIQVSDEVIVSDEMATALETPSEDYLEWFPVWESAKDVSDGEKAVKEKGTKYLPKTGLMEVLKNGDDLYKSYIKRASYFNGTGRTVDGLLGLVYRRSPVVELPAPLDEYVKDINMRGQDISTFSKKYLEEIIIKNRVGVLVDYPVKSDVLSTAEAEKLNMRPFAIMFKAESILDWDEERINNVYKTSYIMLRETERKRQDLTVTSLEKRRVLDLVQPEELLQPEIERLTNAYEDDPARLQDELYRLYATTPRYYRQRIFVKETVTDIDEEANKSSEDARWCQVSEFFPMDVKGNMFEDIPFFVTTDRGVSLDLDYSMVFDLASVNLSLYRNSADLENINHVGTNPTPCAIGLRSTMLSNPNLEENEDAGDEQVALGLNTLLEFGDGGSSWMLEASGQGAVSMEAMMDKKRQEMAVLGSKILASDPNGVEAAETAQIHKQGEQGVLSSAVDAVIETMMNVFSTMYRWQTGTEYEAKKSDFQFNKDFIPGKLAPAVIVSMVQALQSGLMAPSEAFEMMKQGEWINPDKKFEDHSAEILEYLKKKADDENLKFDI